MPEANRPDPRRKKAPASRPGKPRRVSARREIRGAELRAPKEIAGPAGDSGLVDDSGDSAGSIRQSIVASAEQAAEQRFGSAARRAAILAAVVCVLTLTIAGPVRTYFSQRTEMKQLQASEAQLREQIAELEEQKAKLADPVFIAAQARERLGFVMPGEIPYQVQLPPGATQPEASPEELAEAKSNDPWYTTLWHTIADAPHGISPTAPPAGVPGAPEPVVPPHG
ncbi:septum formation initiator family protein [Mycobacterium sp. ITM-2016-00317]|uniref:FtsB family cell division protein n=1 Tax=Mycobacterium sp. ITM-2016-00317 TaxID=2099694 RepID=UPI000D4DDA4B|nr:septum formation initiator family protein [Mycobacterium sp. ITM-2016-00317]WNG86509.1 septum formation initiator family protein [Mycobacterium sp. ITM-2016-00317]